MKRNSILVLMVAAGAMVAGGCAADGSASRPVALGCGGCGGCGAACTVPDGPPTAVNAQTADALRAAVEDERRTQAFYAAVMEKHGQVRPFANIVHAEKRHEQIVTALMERHGVPVPAAGELDRPAVPATLVECNRVAAQLERNNIKMYDRLLNDIQEPDIRTAFENLRAVSQANHLRAFERHS